MPGVDGVTRRPAETAAVAAAVAVLLVHLFGVDDADVLAALTIVVGAVPAAVTFVVELVRRRDGSA